MMTRSVYLVLLLLLGYGWLQYHDTATLSPFYSKVRHELGTWYNVWTRWTRSSDDAWYSRIGDRRLYLGPQPIEERGDRHTLRSALGVTRLVTLLEDFEREPGWLYTPVVALDHDNWSDLGGHGGAHVESGNTNLWFEVVDGEPLEPAVQLHHWVRALHKLLAPEQGNHTVYVHCRSGIGRSVSLVVAYLMFSERLSYWQALDEVQYWRPLARPNAAQRRALMQYGDWLHHWFKLRRLRKQCHRRDSGDDRA